MIPRRIKIICRSCRRGFYYWKRKSNSLKRFCKDCAMRRFLQQKKKSHEKLKHQENLENDHKITQSILDSITEHSSSYDEIFKVLDRCC